MQCDAQSKHRHGWGYERLAGQVSDSFHLRRFCRIAISDEVPDESTVRKLTKRLGAQLVDDLIRETIKVAVAERGFKARALRVDSTVQEADIGYPTDAGLAQDAVKVLARIARRVCQLIPGLTRTVRDRSRAADKRIRTLGRTLRRRTGDKMAEVQKLTEQIAGLARASTSQAERLLKEAKEALTKITGRSRRGVERAISELEEKTALSRKVVEQVRQRFANEKIQDRVVSLHDPSARPIRKGKRSTPTQFGHVAQYAELAANTKGARGLLVPPQVGIGNVHEDNLLPGTVKEITDLKLKPVEACFDGVFTRKATEKLMAPLGCTVFIAGSKTNAGSRRTRKRLASHRVGCEGRIAHLKREYGAGRSRLKGVPGASIWAGWTALAYNLDTVARMLIKKRRE